MDVTLQNLKYDSNGLIPAIIVGFAVPLIADIKHRSLRSDEQDWARRVFGAVAGR